MSTGEVVVTAIVALPVSDTFTAFTDDIDRWWDRRTLDSPSAIVRFESAELVTIEADGATVIGTVAVWNPPNRLEIDWYGPHAQPGDTVIVDFESVDVGTRVTVRHRRRGLNVAQAAGSAIGLWWADVLRRLALSS